MPYMWLGTSHFTLPPWTSSPDFGDSGDFGLSGDFCSGLSISCVAGSYVFIKTPVAVLLYKLLGDEKRPQKSLRFVSRIPVKPCCQPYSYGKILFPSTLRLENAGICYNPQKFVY